MLQSFVIEKFSNVLSKIRMFEIFAVEADRISNFK
jgi:hypothetical protein